MTDYLLCGQNLLAQREVCVPPPPPRSAPSPQRVTSVARSRAGWKGLLEPWKRVTWITIVRKLFTDWDRGYKPTSKQVPQRMDCTWLPKKSYLMTHQTEHTSYRTTIVPFFWTIMWIWIWMWILPCFVSVDSSESSGDSVSVLSQSTHSIRSAGGRETQDTRVKQVTLEEESMAAPDVPSPNIPSGVPEKTHALPSPPSPPKPPLVAPKPKTLYQPNHLACGKVRACEHVTHGLYSGDGKIHLTLET